MEATGIESETAAPCPLGKTIKYNERQLKLVSYVVMA
jgi:hypothetical protein